MGAAAQHHSRNRKGDTISPRGLEHADHPPRPEGEQHSSRRRHGTENRGLRAGEAARRRPHPHPDSASGWDIVSHTNLHGAPC